MSGKIGSAGSRSGVIGERSNVGDTGNLTDTSGSGIWVQNWSNEATVSSTSSPSQFSKTLSGLTVGSKLLIFTTFVGYGGSSDSTNYYHAYLSSSNHANAGMGDKVLICHDLKDITWAASSYSMTHLTNPILVHNPNYRIYFYKYSSAPALYVHAKMVFLEIKN